MHTPLARLVLLALLVAAGLPAPAGFAMSSDVTITPETAPVDTPRDIIAIGLPMGHIVTLRLLPSRRNSQFSDTSANVLKEYVRVDPFGSVVATINTTGLPPGDYEYLINDYEGANDVLVSRHFYVTAAPGQPSLTVEPASGPAGSPFVIQGTNLGANRKLLVRLGEAGGAIPTVFPVTTSASGTIRSTIVTPTFTPGYLYYASAYPAIEVNPPPLTPKAYFALSGLPGQPPAGPRAFTRQFIGPAGGTFTFNLGGFDPGELIGLGVAKDTLPANPAQIQYVAPAVNYRVDQDGQFVFSWDSAKTPPGDFLVIADKPTAEVMGGPTMASHSFVVAAFTVVTPPRLTVQGQTSYPLTVTTTGIGTVAVAPPGSTYLDGTPVTLTPQPQEGALFIGWTVNGQPVGWANPLTITMSAAQSVTATFAAPTAFPDVLPDKPHSVSVAELSARGIIKGYENGTFGPGDGTARAQMAALIARPMDYVDSPTNPFTDRCAPTAPADCVDAELWNRVAQLASRTIARGYTDAATCGGLPNVPCYAPRDYVLHAQVLSFITRAMVAKQYWTLRAIDPTLFGGVLNGTGHEQDVATFVFYTQNFGGVPDYPASGGFAAWNLQSTRGWFARALWAALNSYLSVDRVP